MMATEFKINAYEDKEMATILEYMFLDKHIHVQWHKSPGQTLYTFIINLLLSSKVHTRQVQLVWSTFK